MIWIGWNSKKFFWRSKLSGLGRFGSRKHCSQIVCWKVNEFCCFIHVLTYQSIPWPYQNLYLPFQCCTVILTSKIYCDDLIPILHCSVLFLSIPKHSRRDNTSKAGYSVQENSHNSKLIFVIFRKTTLEWKAIQLELFKQTLTQ